MLNDSEFLSSDSIPAVFGVLENSFSDLLIRLYGVGCHEDDLLFGLLAATLLLESRKGHVVCHLERLSGKRVPPGLSSAPDVYPESFSFVSACSRLNPGTGPFPIVFDRDGKRAWLLRYREIEERIARNLTARAAQSHAFQEDGTAILDRIFGTTFPENSIRRCADIVLGRKLLILSGGPGAGKTTALSRILAVCPAMLSIPPERIILSAPTGKAAARLRESLSGFLSDPSLLDSEKRDYLSKVPSPMTIHRLIAQSTKDQDGNPLPLPVDLLVIDEMSMVDLSLFDRLLGVLSKDAILILSGDPDQLSSVAPGSVFGEILKGVESSDEESPPEISSAITILRKSHRFAGDSGVGRLARWIREGGKEPLDQNALPGVEFRQVGNLSGFYEEVSRDFTPYIKARTLPDAFLALSGVGVLTPLRKGLRGVLEISKNLERRLFPAQSPRRFGERSKMGHPVVVLKNNNDMELSNGDVGIIPFPHWGDPGRVYFSKGDGIDSGIPVEILPPFESALALTVHKSQGSEFSRIHLLLPPSFHPLLTRELLYTAVTRARESLLVWGDLPVFLAGVQNRSEGHSALGDFLWSPSSIL